MKSHRVARVAEVIREVAAETILFELQDPRIKHVTVTRAEVSADLQIAKVFVSVMGTEREQSLWASVPDHSTRLKRNIDTSTPSSASSVPIITNSAVISVVRPLPIVSRAESCW